MLYKLGLLIFLLSIVTADCECLLIPTVLLAVGAGMMMIGKDDPDDEF